MRRILATPLIALPVFCLGVAALVYGTVLISTIRWAITAHGKSRSPVREIKVPRGK